MIPAGEQARADADRVVPELRYTFAVPVPVRSVGQQAGLPPARAEAALQYLANGGVAVEPEPGLWVAVSPDDDRHWSDRPPYWADGAPAEAPDA